MATKTWKLGEVCQGGIITVQTKGEEIVVIGKEWDHSKGGKKSSDQSGAKEFTRKTFSAANPNCNHDMEGFLTSLTLAYYAAQIMAWVASKVKIKGRS